MFLWYSLTQSEREHIVRAVNSQKCNGSGILVVGGRCIFLIIVRVVRIHDIEDKGGLTVFGKSVKEDYCSRPIWHAKDPLNITVIGLDCCTWLQLAARTGNVDLLFFHRCVCSRQPFECTTGNDRQAIKVMQREVGFEHAIATQADYHAPVNLSTEM